MVPCLSVRLLRRVLTHFLLGAAVTTLASWGLGALHPQLLFSVPYHMRFSGEQFSAARWLSPLLHNRKFSGFYPHSRNSSYPGLQGDFRVWSIENLGRDGVVSPGVQIVGTVATIDAERLEPIPFEKTAFPPHWSIALNPRGRFTSVSTGAIQQSSGPTPEQVRNGTMYVEQAAGVPFLAMYGAVRVQRETQEADRPVWAVLLPWRMDIFPYGTTSCVLPLKPIWSGFILNTIFWGGVIAFGRWVWACAVTRPRIRRRFAQHRCVVRRCGFPLADATRCPECGTEQLPVLLGQRKSKPGVKSSAGPKS